MRRSRAYRRHQHWRAVARAKRFINDIVHWDYEDPEIYDRSVHLYTTDRRPCSCWICRNEKYRDFNRHEDKILCRDMLQEWHDNALTKSE